LAHHVHRVPADDEVVLGEVGNDRHVPGAVVRGVGEADGAVAEEVEGAAEAGVGVDVLVTLPSGALRRRTPDRAPA
jgi:hypothetical protein